jgi:hypothetical protein
MFYVHFYPQMPEIGDFWATKRERVYRSLMPGAGGRDRTDDLLFTKQLLCQLSYTGLVIL